MVSDQDIVTFVQANINNPAAVYQAAVTYGVSDTQISHATGYDLALVDAFLNAGALGVTDWNLYHSQQISVSPPPIPTTQSNWVPPTYSPITVSTPSNGNTPVGNSYDTTGLLTLPAISNVTNPPHILPPMQPAPSQGVDTKTLMYIAAAGIAAMLLIH